MNYKTSIIIGATFGLLGVSLGAFGAHALKPLLLANQRLDTFELAVRYQFYHAFALLITGLLQRLGLVSSFPSWFFLFGVIIFSGSLYILSITGITMLGAITPIGGLFFLAGWISMIISIVRSKA